MRSSLRRAGSPTGQVRPGHPRFVTHVPSGPGPQGTSVRPNLLAHSGRRPHDSGASARRRCPHRFIPPLTTEEKAMTVTIGAPAPAFEAEAYVRGHSEPRQVGLNGLDGSWVVLFFY